MISFDELQEYLKQYGAVLFGSRAWSRALDLDSDYDYVLTLGAALELKQRLEDYHGVETTNSEYYVSGYYFRTAEGSLINITGCKRDDWHAWVASCQMMETLKSPPKTISKGYRQVLFETILAIMKKALNSR